MPYNNAQEQGRPVKIKDEGITLVNNVRTIDFTGDGVSGSAIGDEVTEDITGGGSSIPTPISLLNGGFGQSMEQTDINSNGIQINNQTTPTGYLRFYNTGNSVSGFVANGTAKVLFIKNDTSGTLNLIHESTSSTAANRMSLPDGVTFQLNGGTGVILIYNTTTNRWNILSESFKKAGPSSDGWISSVDFSSFNSKPNGSGSDNHMTYWINGGQIGAATDTYWDETLESLSIQNTDNDGTLDIQQENGLSVAAPSSITAQLIAFSTPTPPGSYSVTQIPGHLYAASGFSGSSVTTGGSSAYSGGDSVDYKLYAYNNDMSQTFSVVFATANVGVSNTGDDIMLSWSDNNTGSVSISGYYIIRNVNGGGFNEFIDLGYVTSLDDNGFGWNYGPSTSPQYSDYIANGSSYVFEVYGRKLTPIGTNIFSTYSITTGGTFYDDNSNNPYVIQHDYSSQSDDVRIILNGTDHVDTTGTQFIQDTTPFSSGATVTPTTYGIQSDGSTLNRDYYAYSRTSGSTLFSASASSTVSTSDPNDSNYYYIQIDVTTPLGYCRLVRQTTASGYDGLSTVYDDGITSFSGPTTNSPTVIYNPTLVVKGHGTSSTDPANVVYKQLDGSGTFNISYLNSGSTELSRTSVDSLGLHENGVAFYTFNSVSAGSVPNNSVFRNSATGKLSYKDNSGVVNALY